jgi:hypothetical protein
MTTTSGVGTPQRQSDGSYWVPSSKVGYAVVWCRDAQGTERWVCHCPSMTYRPYQPCKHVKAVHAHLKQGKDGAYRG